MPKKERKEKRPAGQFPKDSWTQTSPRFNWLLDLYELLIEGIQAVHSKGL